MIPLLVDNTTRVLGTPKGWQASKHGPCVGLPVTIDPDNNTFYSYWSVNWKERFQILFGRPVRLAVVSSGHPPVSLDIEKV